MFVVPPVVRVLASLAGASAAPLAAAFAIVSCSGQTATTEPGEGALPCDVDRLVEAQCRSCHAAKPRFGAPMPLKTWADFHRASVTTPNEPVFRRVLARTHDESARMPPPPRAPLRADQQATLDAWLSAGAPSSAAACSTPAADAGADAMPAPVELPPGCPNLSLEAAADYEMPAAALDEYVCFGVDVNLAKKRHIVGFFPRIDNESITHHAVVYLSPYGESPVPHACSGGGALGQRMIFSWAPGGGAFELPKEAGLPLEGNVHLVVQMHYSNLGKLAGQRDRSAIDLCTTTELRPNDADVLAFGADKFIVPPRSTQRVDCEVDVPPSFPAELHVFRALPHMHRLGRAMTSQQDRSGSVTILDEIGAFNFGAQVWRDVSAVLKPGDRVRTSCTWTNGTDVPVSFGEKTSDEMCYHFMMVYPRITLPGWSWDAPVAAAKCTP